MGHAQDHDHHAHGQVHAPASWPMSTTDIALTAHLLIPGGHPGDSFLMHIAEELCDHHGIGHVTLQVETDPTTACALEPDQIV